MSEEALSSLLACCVEAEAVRRAALQRLSFHQYAALRLSHEGDRAALQRLDAMALDAMDDAARAAALAARRVTDGDAAAMAALAADEDLCGRRVVALAEAEARDRQRLAFAAGSAALAVAAAFTPCVRRRYDYAWAVTAATPLPPDPRALAAAVGYDAERHLPAGLRADARAQRPDCQARYEAERAERLGAVLETLAIQPPAREEAPAATEDTTTTTTTGSLPRQITA